MVVGQTWYSTNLLTANPNAVTYTNCTLNAVGSIAVFDRSDTVTHDANSKGNVFYLPAGASAGAVGVTIQALQTF